jgi:uncharacterized protein involved in exopolysaccharide biosynthesis
MSWNAICAMRDYIAQEIKSGGSAEQAFRAGIARIGQAPELKREFVLAETTVRFGALGAFLADWRKCFWASAAIAALVALGFYWRKASVTPVFEAKATVQIMRRPAQPMTNGSGEHVFENDIRAAEELNTVLRLLESNRLRTQVAASLTPGEQRLVGYTAMPSPDHGEKLGVVKVMPMRRSLIVTLAVVHENAEAAALVANRYATQGGSFLADNSERTGPFIRVVDHAVAPRLRHAPNLTRILIGSLMLGLATFGGLLVIAATLRKLVRMRIDFDREMRVS